MTAETLAEKKLAHRRAIMEVAREHFARFGYKRTVIDDIVHEVGIAKGTFYLYFKSKDQLLFELIGELRGRLMKEFRAAVERAGTTAGKLRAILRLSFQSFETYPLLTRIIADDPEFRIVTKLMEQPSFQEEMNQALEDLKTLLKIGIENGDFRADLDLEVVPMVLGMLKFLHYYAGLVELHGMDRHRFVEGVVDLAIHGLSRR